MQAFHTKNLKLKALFPRLSITCDYKKTTTFPDELEIRVDVAEVSPVKFKLQYTMTVENKLVCTAGSTHCFLSTGGRPVSIQKQYPEFYDALLQLKKENEA